MVNVHFIYHQEKSSGLGQPLPKAGKFQCVASSGPGLRLLSKFYYAGPWFTPRDQVPGLFFLFFLGSTGIPGAMNVVQGDSFSSAWCFIVICFISWIRILLCHYCKNLHHSLPQVSSYLWMSILVESPLSWVPTALCATCLLAYKTHFSTWPSMEYGGSSLPHLHSLAREIRSLCNSHTCLPKRTNSLACKHSAWNQRARLRHTLSLAGGVVLALILLLDSLLLRSTTHLVSEVVLFLASCFAAIAVPYFHLRFCSLDASA